MCYGAGAGRGSPIHCSSMVPQSSARCGSSMLSQPDFDFTLKGSRHVGALTGHPSVCHICYKLHNQEMGPTGKGVAQMDRALKWTFPVLVLIEIGLVRAGMLSLKIA